MALEQIGTEAIVKGFNQFMANMQSMEGQYQKTAGTFSKQSSRAGSSITGMIGKVAGAAVGFSLITKGLDFVGNAISNVTTALPKLAIAAAPLPGIAQAFSASAQRTGLSLEALRSAARGTVADFELMRVANVALTGAGEMLGREMGEKLPGLLEIARASAKATGKDVNFLFDSLVSGVKRGSPMLIDNTGLVLKLGEANAKMAAEVGVAVEDLSAEQKQIALLNATLEAGQGLVSQFGTEQASAAENMAAIRAQAQNITDTIGLALQPALATITGTIAELVERFSDAIQEGGALYPVLVNLGAALSLVADAFSAALNWVVGWVTDFQSTLFDGMGDTAEGMFSYGVEIIAALAEGIISAASTVLISAMSYIGDILASWLAPGSPPRVAEEIDKWGAGTFTEYLKGFSDADFSVLDKVQGILKKLLSGSEFASFSADLAKMLSGGEVDESFYTKLKAALGDYGEEVEALIKAELKLVDAIKKVKAAEEELTEAQEAEEEAQDRVEDLTDEYNELLRAGASKEVLKAKLKEIEAAEKQKKAAEEATEAAEEAVEAAEEEAEAAEEEATTQEKIIAQLLEMMEAREKDAKSSEKQVKAISKLAAGLKGATEAASALASAFSGTGFDIAGRIGEAIEAAKEALQGRLADLFAPLGEAWQRSVEGPLAELAATFLKFQDQLSELGITWDSVWQGIMTVSSTVSAVVWSTMMGLSGGVAAALDTLVDAWSTAVDSLHGIISGFTTWFIGMSALIKGILTGDFPLALTGFMEAWEGAWEFVKNILRFLLNAVTATLRTIISAVAGFVKTFIAWFQELYDQLFGESIIPDIIAGFQTLIDFFREKLGPTIEWFMKEIITPFREGLERVVEYILLLIRYVKKLRAALKKVDGAADELSSHSPSPLEKGLRGAGKAMQELSRVELPKLQTAFQMQAAGASNGSSTVVNNTQNTTYNLAVNTTQGAGAVTSNYHMMRAMSGVS